MLRPGQRNETDLGIEAKGANNLNTDEMLESYTHDDSRLLPAAAVAHDNNILVAKVLRRKILGPASRMDNASRELILSLKRNTVGFRKGTSRTDENLAVDVNIAVIDEVTERHVVDVLLRVPVRTDIVVRETETVGDTLGLDNVGPV